MKFIFLIFSFCIWILNHGENAAGIMFDHSLKKEMLKRDIEKYVENQKGVIAVSLLIPGENIYLGINDTMVFHAASTMKVPVMCELFRRIEAGEIRLDEKVLVKNEFASIIDGSSYQLDIADDSGDSLYSMLGKPVTIEFLIKDMITVSGNLSTNILIEIVGADKVQLLMSKINANEMRILRGVEDIKAFRAGKNNVTTARALTTIFEAILNERICNKTNTDRMIAILYQQKFRDKIPARLPGSVKVAHKTGSITAISHDAGIIYPENKPPYVLSVLTSKFEDSVLAKECIAEISKRIYDWYISF